MQATVRLSSANKYRSFSSPSTLCCLQLPNKLLYLWTLEKRNLNITYVHQLNSCSIHCNNLVQTAYQFIERSNLEARISSKGRKLKSRVEKCSRKKKESLLECMCMVDINRSDVVSKDAVIQSLEDDNVALRFRVINTHCGDIISNFL